MAGRRRAFGVLAAFTLIGGLGFAIYQQNPSGPNAKTVSHSWGHVLSPPPSFTVEDETAAITALLNGDPLPAGWSVDEMTQEITASLTGVVDQATGQEQLIVTLEDDSPDIQYANLYLDGALVLSATRTNGAIVDKDGIATASLTVWIPAEPLHTVALEWASSSGHVSVDTVTF